MIQNYTTHYKSYIITLLILLIQHSPLTAAVSERVHTTDIGVLDGLSHGSVKSLYQDEDGLMWISTSGGVNTYDGIEVQSVNVDPTMPIHSPLYGEIEADRHHNMWFYISDDIVIYNKRSGENTLLSEICASNDFVSPKVRFAPNGNAMVFDTNNIYILKWSEDRYIYQGTSTLSSNISDILPVSDREVLVATSSGIYLIQDDKLSLISEIGSSGLYAINGGIYICDHQGIYILRPGCQFEKLNDLPYAKIILVNDTFWMSTHDQLYSVKMVNSEIPATTPTLRIDDLGINDLHRDFNNQLWLATNQGIRIINSNTRLFNPIEFPASISNNDIRSIHEDESDNIWIGSWGTDATLLFAPKGDYSQARTVDLGVKPSSIHFIQSVGHDIYVATNKVLRIRWNGSYSDPQFESTTVVDRLYNNDLILMCRLDATRENLWLGFYDNGIFRYSIKDETLTKINIPFESHNPKSVGVRNLLFDKNDNLWIATCDGLYVVDNRVLDPEGGYQTHKYQYDRESKGGLSYNYVLSLLLDNEGYAWVGTFGGGLFRTKLDQKGLPTTFEEIEGLPNKVINSLELDPHGNIWISTNHGLCHFDTTTEAISLYNSQNGVWWLKFGELTSTSRQNGEMVFGYNGGLITFKDELITKDIIAPKVYLKSLYIRNNRVGIGDEVGGRVVLDCNINHCKKIELKYSENQFGFDFEAIHYANPMLVKCKYILEGVDQDWITTDVYNNSVRYTNIPSGRYTFKVQGANSDNYWSDIHSIVIVVQKPWWSSNLAIVCYLILLSIALYVIYRYITHRARDKMIVRYAEKERERIENLAQMQNTFFTNISHEFRTPLSLILAPSKELIQRDNLDDDNMKLLRRIDYNANILLRLINLLLDFSRFNDNKLKRNPQLEDMVIFLHRTLNQFAEIATLQKVKLTIECSDKELLCTIDYNMLEQILYNLISNSLKHTPEMGSVKVILEREGNNITIRVADNGSGIPSDIQANIFDRFVMGTQGGTGIGLNFTKNLVEMNGGTISFETSPKGTTFTTSFPGIVSESVAKESHEVESISINDTTTNNPAQPTDSYFDAELEAKGDKERLTLLIVEDNISLLDYLRSYFEREYNVETATNGLLGYNSAIAIQPNIIISDVMMPEMSGDKMCQKLKSNSESSHIPIILLSALSSISDTTHGYNQGADIYCAKPFDIELLNSAVKSLIENRNRIHSRFNTAIDIDVAEVVSNRSDEDLIRRAIAFIEENIHEENLSIVKVAEHLDLSYYLLNKKLQSLLGLKGSAFIRNIRLKYAAKVLLQSDNSIAEVTYSLGFSDLKYFRKQFTEMFGVTPSEYKRQNGKG